jgi:hypothetical protein
MTRTVAFYGARLHDCNVVAAGLKGAAGVNRGGSGAPAGAGGSGETRFPAYFYRLSPRAQRIYLASDAIERFSFGASSAVLKMTESLIAELESGAPSRVERAAQDLIDELCRITAQPKLRLQVRSVRPHNARGELHGIFYPRGPGRANGDPARQSAHHFGLPLIILWMRTARRHDIVRPRTFLRTLMHEFAHYLDYALLRLGDSPHTAGFFKRESFLMRMISSAASPNQSDGNSDRDS